jgi:nucleotide-binding universal stress UspA family protein
MTMKILVPVDGSTAAKSALAFVAGRSPFLGADPHVQLLNVQLPVPARAAAAVGRDIVRTFHKEEALRMLKPALATMQRAGVAARGRHVVGSPGASIGKLATQSHADLIVMGTRGRSAWKGLVLGSTAHGVLASCTTPILLLRGERAVPDGALHVGVATDGSAHALAALKWLVSHRAIWGEGARFTLLHVRPDSADPTQGLGSAAAFEGGVGMFTPELLEKYEAGLQAAADAAVAPAIKLMKQAKLEHAVHFAKGFDAGEVLSQAARKLKLDVLLMGSHGRGAFTSVVMGSVATRVSARSDVPLLLVR